MNFAVAFTMKRNSCDDVNLCQLMSRFLTALRCAINWNRTTWRHWRIAMISIDCRWRWNVANWIRRHLFLFVKIAFERFRFLASRSSENLCASSRARNAKIASRDFVIFLNERHRLQSQTWNVKNEKSYVRSSTDKLLKYLSTIKSIFASNQFKINFALFERSCDSTKSSSSHFRSSHSRSSFFCSSHFF